MYARAQGSLDDYQKLLELELSKLTFPSLEALARQAGACDMNDGLTHQIFNIIPGTTYFDLTCRIPTRYLCDLVATILAENSKINRVQLYRAFLDHRQLRSSANYLLEDIAHDVLPLVGRGRSAG